MKLTKKIIRSLESNKKNKDNPCWKGYERVPNTKEGEKGSCRKKVK